MFANTKATNSFAVDDVQKAREFYGETLGLETKALSEEFGVMSIEMAGGRSTLVYAKPGFAPATLRRFAKIAGVDLPTPERQRGLFDEE